MFSKKDCLVEGTISFRGEGETNFDNEHFFQFIDLFHAPLCYPEEGSIGIGEDS